MSDAFEPGAGWREVDPESVGRRDLHLTDPETGRVVRSWVREAPVPLLPTVENTVIEATWLTGEVVRIWLVSGSGLGALWVDREGRPVATRGITGFEVLAEPIPAGSAVYTSEQLNAIIDGARAGTAKAVLDRVNDVLDGETPWITLMTRLLREFGVTS